jgi:Zn-dependent protease with chaperone function
MQELFTYLLKSSALIAAFFLAYHFLLRKETFFNSNRWFLIAGLITSVTLPLFFIKKIIFVEKPKISIEDLVAITNQSSTTNTIQQSVAPPIDWIQMVTTVYILIVLFLFLKIIVNVISLFKILNNKQIAKQETFSLVDLQENIAPFSFFNFIVFNSSLYSKDELESILLHEKVHSQQKHSFDVLIAKLFSILFWFNPFVWLYKKAIVQNLEYIADSKAIQQIEDKKVYQKALLKVVTHQSCLPITNHFYQSLIKKRIVMLNKNQSHKRNSWKYAVVIPALIAFVFLFQVKIIAQEKESLTTSNKRVENKDEIRLVINKNSSEEKLKEEAKKLKDDYGVTLKYSKVKRNTKGEITGIKVEFKDKDGNKGVSHVEGKEPISPIHFYKNDESIGFGKPRGVRVFRTNSSTNDEGGYGFNFNDSIPELKNFNFDIEIPELTELAELGELGKLSEGITWNSDDNSKIVIKRNGSKPLVIINGKVVGGEDGTLNKEELEELKNSIKMNDDGEETQIIINGEELSKIRKEAMEDAQIHIRKMNPKIKAEVRKSMEHARKDMERARPEMQRAREEMDRSRPEMEKAREEMMLAKEEMLKAKAEMEQAKRELEKAKADLNKKK